MGTELCQNLYSGPLIDWFTPKKETLGFCYDQCHYLILPQQSAEECFIIMFNLVTLVHKPVTSKNTAKTFIKLGKSYVYDLIINY